MEDTTLPSAKTNSMINGTTTMILEFPKLPKRVFRHERHISYSTVGELFDQSAANLAKRPNKLPEPFHPNHLVPLDLRRHHPRPLKPVIID